MASTVIGRASGVGFKGYIKGGPELMAKLAEVQDSVREELLVQATTAAAEVIADEWRSQVEARIGRGPGVAHYADAIGVRAQPGKTGATAYVGLPNDVPQNEGEDHPREYAPRLEFGDRSRAAQPTLRPAFDATRLKATDAMGAKIKDLISRVADL